MMNFAVMSDLHVGLAARAKDLCPEPPSTAKKDRKKYLEKSEDAYRRKFVQFIKDKGITADYLVLPGDLTNLSTPPEVEIASEFVLEAADSLGVSHDKIVFAPGNHDVDWSSFDPRDSTGVKWEQRYFPIGHKKFFFRKIVDRGFGDVFLPPHFGVWEFDDLLVIGYNSASHDHPIHKDAAHHGLVDPEHLNEIRQYLSRIGPPDGRVRLFLVHHHLIDFSAPLPEPDFSLMTNADNLLNLLHECSFDLVIHGHKHHPRFDTHSTLTYPHLPILCSGSFSVEIDTRWAGTVDNQFHLVTINGREGSENRITGIITSWTNNYARGWIPSEESTSGIHHKIPFGSYVMPHELDTRLEPFVRKVLAIHNHVLWKNVIEEFPELEYLPLNSAIAAFERISRMLGKHSMYKTLQDLIIY